MVYEEDDECNSEKHGKTVAGIVRDVIDKIQNFDFRVFQEEMRKARKARGDDGDDPLEAELC
jgi:hypothetical protein